MALALAAPVAFLLPVTRRVLEAGQTHRDLVEALRGDVDRQRETLAFQFGKGETLIERLARRMAYAGMVLFGLGAGLGLLLGGLAADPAVGAVAANRHQRRRDVIGERWLRFWSSRLGEWVAQLAGLGLKRLPAGAGLGSTTAIALAAARLLGDLPPEVREVLRDLPDALRRLERQTGGLRRWIEELDTSFTDEREIPSPKVVKCRDTAQHLLTQSTSALEASRLELQRLHDGSGTAEGVTVELEAAREIGEAVDRLLHGRGEGGYA